MAKKIKVWDGTKWEDVTPSLPVALIDHSHNQYITSVTSGTGITVSSSSGIATVSANTSVVATLTGSQTLTNKTITAPVIISPEERISILSTAVTGTVNIDVNTSTFFYYTTNTSANWTFNFRGNSGTPFSDILNTGDSVTVSILITNGATAYIPTAFQIDGSPITPKWSGGTAPASGNANSIDVYSFTFIQTADSIFTVIAAGPIKYV
jgi:hypothetical protein